MAIPIESIPVSKLESDLHECVFVIIAEATMHSNSEIRATAVRNYRNILAELVRRAEIATEARNE